ncbi:Uncharacterised protein [Halioglobus japonicus]|nr:Uncharacterised protein [Halioglobus japonicus]
MSKESIFLLIAAAGLTPIALAYGLVPAVTAPMLYDVDIDSINIAHIFRAVMGLYLAMVVFWILGATREPLRFAALCSVVVFMAGLALGRVVSLVVDGMPGVLLVIYLLLEIGFAFVALKLAKNYQRS